MKNVRCQTESFRQQNLKSYVKMFLTGKKLSDCVLENWDIHQKMPVKYEMQD